MKQVPTIARGQESAVADRLAELERRLGDPYDPANPAGYAEVLRADGAAEIPAGGERVLSEFGLDAEFVPAELGGRLDRIDTLARVLRSVFRRDATLGLGYGATSFNSAVNIWIAGDYEQRRWIADLLLGGGKMAVARHELAHGNDFVRNEFEARPDQAGFVLSGRKEVINNASRADALAIFGRTDPAVSSRSHSVLLVDPRQLPAARWRGLPRYTTLGVRGCSFSGVEFNDCPVPPSALVGELGSGVELALRSFQITRSMLPSMVHAVADSALRAVVRFAVTRDQHRQVRTTLGGAFTDLLICDCLSLVATRAVHLLPGETSVYAAAARYLAPKVVQEALYDLSIVLGEWFYVKEGDYGVFQKAVRDIPVISLGHVGSAACQATIVPQLPRLARSAWFAGDEAPASLFRPEADLPPLRFDRLSLAAKQDAICASLVAAAGMASSGHSPAERVVRDLAQRMSIELRDLQRQCQAMTSRDRSALASPASFALADRYAHVLAAAAVINVWRYNRDGSDPFLTDPSWAAMALCRLARRLGQPVPDLPPEAGDRMYREALDRHEQQRSYDLYGTPLGADGKESSA